MIAGEIRELSLLADLDSIALRYERHFGAPPINLSLWNPAPAIVQDLDLALPPSLDLSGINYAFSYELPERLALLEELGFSPTTHGCLVTHSGSAGIVAAANWLKSCGCQRVLVIGPRYFTVPYALVSLGMQARLAYLRRSATGFSFANIQEFVQRGIDAVWLTNPIYCTSVDYEMEELSRFMNVVLQDGLHVVIDECLAEQGRRIAPNFSTNRIVAIYAPHKSICVNGVKFAAVVFGRTEQNHFDSWCDIWNGCLPISSVVGVRHFLSPEFLRYRNEFHSIISGQRGKVCDLAARMSSITLDSSADGYLISIYAPHLDSSAGMDLAFLERAAIATGAIFISGARNGLDPKAGLSFRLNLSALDTAAFGALARLCDWLDRSSFV